MILIRFALISLIVYLLIRSFTRLNEGNKPSAPGSGPDRNSKISSKGVSKEIGEYVDYEEVDK